MAKRHAPRKGSLQYWPRKRAKKEVARVRRWAEVKEGGLLGFLGYKVGMSHFMFIDNRASSMTKGEEISLPVTIIECPGVKVMGINFYKKDGGLRLVSSVLAEKLDKELARKICVAKKVKKLEETRDLDWDDLRLVVYSQPWLMGIQKKPHLKEMALGGSKEEKLNYAKEKLGKEIKVEEVFKEGELVDVHGVTKGRGFVGTRKRYGTGRLPHKSEKGVRGIGTLGAWTPKRVSWTVAQAGKRGYHLRTEYNKWLLKMGKKEEAGKINPKGGFIKYGLVKNDYLLLKGSVAGARKRVLVLSKAMRGKKKEEVPVMIG